MSPRTIRPPVKWHGGKHYLAKRIVARFVPHHTYVEPFGGGASVLLNKEPSKVEVYNDLDERITRLFRVIRDRGEEFRLQLSLTPYSEREFESAVEPATDELEQARRDFVRWRMSLGGRAKGFSFTKHRVRRGMADVVSGYLSMIDNEMPVIIERLRTVQIVCRPAENVISKWDSSNTLVYCDPPYVHATRDSSATDIYGHEMTDEAHEHLASVLCNCKSKVILSGYPSPLYTKLYRKWSSKTIEIPNHAAGGKEKEIKKEVLWYNW